MSIWKKKETWKTWSRFPVLYPAFSEVMMEAGVISPHAENSVDGETLSTQEKQAQLFRVVK